MALESLQFPGPLQDRTLDNVPSQGVGNAGREEMAMMEAALMSSAESAVSGPRRRKRTKYNSWQKNLLEKAYAVCKYPNVWTRETLSKALNVDDARIIVWFQNRRARYSRQSAAGRQRGRPSVSGAFENQLPVGTFNYANPAGPAPAQGPCAESCGRLPLGEVAHGPNALPPIGGHALPGLKLEGGAPFAESCSAGHYGHWCPLPGTPSAGAPARYPVDEIEVDFTIADFNMDAGNQYLLDLTQGL